MPNFAVIDNKTVTNIIVAETKEIAEEVTGKTCIEYDPTSGNGAHIGLTYDSKTKIFEQP